MSKKSKEFYKKEREKYRKSGDDFKKQLKICETNCKNDKQYKQQLQYELDIVNKKEYSKKNLNNKEVLKKMIKGNMLNKCSYKCLNDKCIYTGLQESVRGPKKHAYLFPEGETMKGQDGKQWIVSIDKFKLHKWVHKKCYHKLKTKKKGGGGG